MIGLSSSDLVGEKVLSMDFGVGVITAIERIDAREEDYYVIEYGKKNVKNYFPIKNNKKIRFVSSKELLEQSLKSFRERSDLRKFSSSKERQSHFDSAFGLKIEQITTRIFELSSVDKRSLKEQNVIDKLLETLELECSIVFKMNASDSKEFVAKFYSDKK